MDKLLFNVTFENDAQARSFAADFVRYTPTVRRAIGTERLDLIDGERRDRSVSDERLAPVEEGDYEPSG